jgi:hypothetical protein
MLTWSSEEEEEEEEAEAEAEEVHPVLKQSLDRY